MKLLPEPFDTIVPAVLFSLGQLFVVTSTWALGITGTFLGDYFGILMDHRVEGFPFNVLRDPMYVGSTMSFAATALWCVLSKMKFSEKVKFMYVKPCSSGNPLSRPRQRGLLLHMVLHSECTCDIDVD